MKGDMGVTQGNITLRGLPCVTVLIGVYDRTSGLPVGGVVNQPFAEYDSEKKRYLVDLFPCCCIAKLMYVLLMTYMQI